MQVGGTRGVLEEETVSESDPSEFLKKRFPSGLERLYRIVQLEPVVYHANLSFSEEGMQWRTDMVGGPVVSRAHLARVTTEENSTKKNNRQKFQCHAVVFGNMPEKATKDLLFEFSYDSVVEPSTFEAPCNCFLKTIFKTKTKSATLRIFFGRSFHRSGGSFEFVDLSQSSTT